MNIIKFLSVVISAALVLCSCKPAELPDENSVVALIYGDVYSDVFDEEFKSGNDEYEFITYNSFSDAVVAIESGVADFSVIDGFLFFMDNTLGIVSEIIVLIFMKMSSWFLILIRLLIS